MIPHIDTDLRKENANFTIPINKKQTVQHGICISCHHLKWKIGYYFQVLKQLLRGRY